MNNTKQILIVIMAVPIILLIALFVISINRPSIMVVNDDLIGKSIMLIHGDTVVPKHKYPQKTIKGRFFYYHKGERIDTVFIPEEISIIGPHIVDYKRDKLFLLIDRKHLDSVFGRYVSWEENLEYVGRKDFPSDNKIRQQMLDNSKIHVYYIIKQPTADVYGPLTFDEYKAKKKDLGVSESLKLKSEK